MTINWNSTHIMSLGFDSILGIKTNIIIVHILYLIFCYNGKFGVLVLFQNSSFRYAMMILVNIIYSKKLSWKFIIQRLMFTVKIVLIVIRRFHNHFLFKVESEMKINICSSIQMQKNKDTVTLFLLFICFTSFLLA